MSTPGTISRQGPLPERLRLLDHPANAAALQRRAGYKTNRACSLGTGRDVDPVWLVSWEDDLVMTNVRSFDVKAYDNAFAGYADLGWGDDLRLYAAVPGLRRLTPRDLP